MYVQHVHTVAANKNFPLARPYNASPWIKTVIRLSASLKLRCLRATVCEPTVDVVLGEVGVILKNNNVARAPMANTVELPFFIHGQALYGRASETERELFIGGYCTYLFQSLSIININFN